jgi:hypothetical protein
MQTNANKQVKTSTEQNAPSASDVLSSAVDCHSALSAAACPKRRSGASPRGVQQQQAVAVDKAVAVVDELQAKSDQTELKAKDQAISALLELKTAQNSSALFNDLQTKACHTKEIAKDKAIVIYHDVKLRSLNTKDKTLAIVRNPEFQQCTVLTAGGAIAFGSVGGAFGCASGIIVGSAAGVVPALFTLGLSIPAGAVVGGAGGLFSGVLLGGSTGGVAGLTSYKYRIQIKNGMMTVKVKVCDVSDNAKAQALKLCSNTQNQVFRAKVAISDVATKYASKVKESSLAAAQLAKTRASDAYTFTTTTKVGVVTSSTAAGAVVGGTTIGAVGTLAGAAVGVIPAIFTFGLSIPVGAVIGMCAGTTIGGGVGAVGGGIAGYTGFTHGNAIKGSVKETLAAASCKAENVKIKVFTCAEDVKSNVSQRVRSCTGGSAQDK